MFSISINISEVVAPANSSQIKTSKMPDLPVVQESDVAASGRQAKRRRLDDASPTSSEQEVHESIGAEAEIMDEQTEINDGVDLAETQIQVQISVIWEGSSSSSREFRGGMLALPRGTPLVSHFVFQ